MFSRERSVLQENINTRFAAGERLYHERLTKLRSKTKEISHFRCVLSFTNHSAQDWKLPTVCAMSKNQVVWQCFSTGSGSVWHRAGKKTDARAFWALGVMHEPVRAGRSGRCNSKNACVTRTAKEAFRA